MEGLVYLIPFPSRDLFCSQSHSFFHFIYTFSISYLTWRKSEDWLDDRSQFIKLTNDYRTKWLVSWRTCKSPFTDDDTPLLIKFNSYDVFERSTWIPVILGLNTCVHANRSYQRVSTSFRFLDLSVSYHPQIKWREWFQVLDLSHCGMTYFSVPS